MPPVSERALARTLGHRAYADTWNVVVDYRRYHRYMATHDVDGYHTAADALGLPAGRLSNWYLDDATPEPVKLVEWAREKGITTAGFGSETFETLNTMLAWLLSDGTLSHQYAPNWTYASDAAKAAITDALDTLSLPWELYEDGRTRLRVTEHAKAIGRVLSVLGAPVGKEADAWARLPSYLRGAPHGTRERFCRVFVRNRAAVADGQLAVRTQSKREGFRADFRRLLHEVTGEDVETQDTYLVLDGPEEWLGWD